MSLITIVGVLGLITISIAIWVRNEKQQDLLFIVGGVSLLIHSIGIGSVIFTVLQVVFILSSLFELIMLRKRDNTEKKR